LNTIVSLAESAKGTSNKAQPLFTATSF
jgi:hypothetical protein